MGNTRKHIKSLTGGVSQQPDSERKDSQCTAQNNFLSDPIRGLVKRTGTTYVQQALSANGLTSPASLRYKAKHTFSHVIDRSDGEQLMLVIAHDGATGGDSAVDMELWKLNEEDGTKELMVIHDKDGNVIDSADTNYLDVTDTHATHPFAATTISDYTFILNRMKTTAYKPVGRGELSMTGRSHVRRGMIFIKEGAYNAEYTVVARDSEGQTRNITVKTSNSELGAVVGSLPPAGINDAKTDYITDALEAALRSGSDAVTDVIYPTTSNIKTTWTSSTSANHIWNGIGGTTALSGSNYAYAEFMIEEQPVPNGSGQCSIQIGTNVYRFSSDTTGATVNVQLGDDIFHTMVNLAAAVNADSALGVKATASVQWNTQNSFAFPFGTNPPWARINVASGIDGTAGNFSRVVLGGSGSITMTSTEVATGATASSECPARHRLNFRKEGSVISWWATYPTREAAEDSSISIDITDSYGDTMVSSFSEVVETFDGLPVVGQHGFELKVEGNADSVHDDYYIRFESNDSHAQPDGIGNGRWVETKVDDALHGIDASSMPHQLVKKDATTYTFEESPWDPKTVGDSISDAPPSFMEKNINDIFYHKSRLGLLSGETATFSELHDPFNFWRTTVTASLDTDPISITSSVNDITTLRYAVPFASELLIFSDRTQFMLTYGVDGLTPSTASLALISRYDASPSVRPAANETSIIFVQQKSGASAVYEMYPTKERQFDAVDISDHIPTYIKGNVIELRTSSLSSAYVVQTDSNDNVVYVYKYLNRNEKRVVSSWSKFTFACDYIKGLHFVSNKLHLIESHKVTTSENEVQVHSLFSYTTLDNTDDLTSAVDCAYAVPASAIDWNSAIADKSVITIEWPINDRDSRKANVICYDVSDNTIYTDDGTGSTSQFVVDGIDLTGKSLVVGIKYVAEYVFSNQYLKRQSADQREMAIVDGRTVTKWVELYFNDTQHLKVDVTFPSYLNKTPSSKTYTGAFDGGVIAGGNYETRTLRTSVASRNDTPTITLSSATHQTVTITGASFELSHTSRITNIS